MPIVEKLMASLVARYGEEEGRKAYYAMEAAGKGPFAPGAKYRELHEAWAARQGVRPVGTKPRPPKKGGASRPRGMPKRR